MSHKPNEINSVRDEWGDMARQVLLLFPRWVKDRISGDGEAGYPVVIKAIPVVIVMLSIASISVINSRADAHHAGWNSPLVSTGIAVLVPLATLAAALIQKRGWAALFWVVAFFVAFVSGTIQYNVYVDRSAVGIEALEAYAFGYGIPFAEVLFAIMEAVSINQWMQQQRTSRAEKDQEAEREREREREEAERERVDAEMEREREREAAERERMRIFEDRKREAELAAHVEALALKTELAREKALAQIRIKEANAGGEKEASVSQPATDRDAQLAMLEIYKDDPGISDQALAGRVGLSRRAVRSLLSELAEKEVVNVTPKGRGKVVTVNGKEGAFRAGEL